MLGTPELDAALQGGLTRVEQRGRIPSLDLLVTLLEMQPRTRLAFCENLTILPTKNPSAHACIPEGFSHLKSWGCWK